MANTRELRRRIKSIKNTSQITKAMQMVSTTKMRRAQGQALNGRPYALTLAEVLSRVSGKVNLAQHQLLHAGSAKRAAVLVLTSDKGLCGALNTNVLRKLQSEEKISGQDVDIYTIGKKGRDFVVRTGRKLVADFENSEKVEFIAVARVRKMLVEAFLKEDVSEVYLLYPQFVSTLRQEAELVRLLPTSFETPDVSEVTSGVSSYGGEFLYEPSLAQVLDFALVHEVDIQIYQALLETKASEHSARMMAMQNATDNALELVDDLNLTYNQVRQGAITTELLEITSAQAALE